MGLGRDDRDLGSSECASSERGVEVRSDGILDGVDLVASESAWNSAKLGMSWAVMLAPRPRGLRSQMETSGNMDWMDNASAEDK